MPARAAWRQSTRVSEMEMAAGIDPGSDGRGGDGGIVGGRDIWYRCIRAV
jgi:hypothetical protein